MQRIVRVRQKGRGDDALPADSIMASPAQRRAHRGEVIGSGGAHYAFALDQPVLLRMGDLCELENGTLVEVVVEPEPLIEVRGRDPIHLARLAWHLGDRHVPVQVLPNRLRTPADGVIEALLTSLGARVVAIEAPFDPEGGAYAAPAARHDHHHDHAHHGHDHHHHHGHDHCHHDHGHHHDHHRHD